MTPTLSLWSLFVPVALLLVSCTPERSCGKFVPEIFSDFHHVGSFPAGTLLPPELDRVQPMPMAFRLGTAYAFVPIGPVETEIFALQTLPGRLRRAGVHVIYAPRSEDDMAVASLGSPFWTIKFEDRQCHGSIYNRFNRRLYDQQASLPRGSHHTYIIEFDR